MNRKITRLSSASICYLARDPSSSQNPSLGLASASLPSGPSSSSSSATTQHSTSDSPYNCWTSIRQGTLWSQGQSPTWVWSQLPMKSISVTMMSLSLRSSRRGMPGQSLPLTTASNSAFFSAESISSSRYWRSLSTCSEFSSRNASWPVRSSLNS